MTDYPPPPDLGAAASAPEITSYLRQLRAWAGHVSYANLVRRINARRGDGPPARQTTVYDCFRPDRQRLDADLVVDIAAALGLDGSRLAALRHAVAIATGQSETIEIPATAATFPTLSQHFTGRTRQLRAIADGLARGVRMVAIVGPAGVGKTELAVAAAQLWAPADRRPSGRAVTGARLFVDLRGSDLDRPPLAPLAVVTGLLRQLGVADDEIYLRRTLADRADLLSQVLSGQEGLLVLDNAADAEQVRAVLPARDSCLVIVTSRRQFPPAPRRLVVPLDALTPPEAQQLLAKFDRFGRVAAEPRQARRLADELCFRMPLDLTALGSRLADPAEAGWRLADHVARLESFPADEVSRPALAASYHRLPPPAQRMFRLLALHPGSDFTEHDAAALAAVPVPAAGRSLAQLCAWHLLGEPQPARYRLHDAVRSYADRLGRDQDPLRERDAAFDRLLAYHRAVVAVAMRALEPATLAWLDSERDNLLATASAAADRGWLENTCYLSRTLPRYLDLGGHWLAAEGLHARASQTGDATARATALVNLGYVRFRLASYGAAAAHFREALAVFDRRQDRAAQARCQHGLALVHYRLGEHRRAEAQWERALAGFRETGHRPSEAAVLSNLGALAERQRRYAEAYRYHHRALELAQELGDPNVELAARNNLGLDCVRLDRLADARTHLDRALRLTQDLGARASGCETRRLLGFALRAEGDLDGAREQCELALAGYRELGNREGETLLRNDLAEVHRLRGDTAAAMAQHRLAKELAEQLGMREEAARAHAGMGELFADQGALAQAAANWQAAEAIYRELQLPEAGDVRDRLARIPVDGAAPAS